ncbi:MAG: 2-oxoacid:acceptor oxidoreductase family protein [Desulfobacterales bacterium]|nr:2-oxoacid:acceptor oxidoreductase family protein [Desulfobacterales bacterium]
MNKEFIEIRWHGRGGQGAITAAKIVAGAAFVSGYPGVVMAPSFGTERRGAPVMTSLKISREKIYDLSPIETPGYCCRPGPPAACRGGCNARPQTRRNHRFEHTQGF